jgi:hypothetical protein
LERLFDRCPDVDVGVAANENVRMSDLLSDPRFLRALNKMIEEHPESASGTRPESGDGSSQIVGTVEGFDDDSSMSEVITPDPLE